MSRTVLGVIPARLDSRRLPGKVLLPIQGLPMVVRVYQQAKKARTLFSIVVATDSQEVSRTVKKWDIPVVMTSSKHRSGTERVAEVAEKINKEIYINIQADEPFIDPEVIEGVANALLENPELSMATAATRRVTPEELKNPNAVKMLIDDKGFARDFFRIVQEVGSRDRKKSDMIYKHIGIYGYRRDFLNEFVKMPPTKREIALSLEQLRALDHGGRIRVVLTDCPSMGVDTWEDLQKAIEEVKKGELDCVEAI